MASDGFGRLRMASDGFGGLRMTSDGFGRLLVRSALPPLLHLSPSSHSQLSLSTLPLPHLPLSLLSSLLSGQRRRRGGWRGLSPRHPAAARRPRPSPRSSRSASIARSSTRHRRRPRRSSTTCFEDGRLATSRPLRFERQSSSNQVAIKWQSSSNQRDLSSSLL